MGQTGQEKVQCLYKKKKKKPVSDVKLFTSNLISEKFMNGKIEILTYTVFRDLFAHFQNGRIQSGGFYSDN